jgi:arylsulfatase A-like enzyme
MAVKGEEVRDDGALMMCTGPTAAWGDGQEWRAFRTRRYKYAVYRSDQQEFLFDLENDPYERNNLAGDPEYRDRT